MLPQSWSPDGEALAFWEVSQDGLRLWVTRPEGTPEPLTGTGYNASAAVFAPGGGWIAYSSDQSGQREIYVRRFPGTGQPIPVSLGGGREPAWSPDGDELYYRNGHWMMAVPIVPTKPELETREPVVLWERPYFSLETPFLTYDVAADGRFLMVAIPDVEETRTRTIQVVLDWLDEVRGLTAGEP